MESKDVSRRGFLTSSLAGASAFQIIKPELVRGAGNEKLKAGLVGCGGRGTAGHPEHPDRARTTSRSSRWPTFSKTVWKTVSASPKPSAPSCRTASRWMPSTSFIGFDAYKKVIESVDIVMLATYPAYRPMHFEAAVEAKKHIFCEKPFGTDPVNLRRFMAAAKKSEELKLTVKSGAQRRSQAWYLDQLQAAQERRDRRHRRA